MLPVQLLVIGSFELKQINFNWALYSNLFIYQARESSLVPVGFLMAQFLQNLLFMKPLL